MRTSIIALLASALLLATALSSFAIQINVPDDFETIQAAIEAADDGDEIIVAPGEYEENIDFLGKAVTVLGNPENPSEVVIDGNQNGASVVAFRNNEDENSILNGFTIQNGRTDYGGGIYCNEASPTLTNLIITSNSTSRNGAGVYCTNHAMPHLSNLQVTENIADEQGGGISVRSNAHPIVENASFINNTSLHLGGGGVHCSIADITLRNVIIEGNVAENEVDEDGRSYGGGILCSEDCNLIFESGSIQGNRSSYSGGAICAISTDVTISSVLIANNIGQQAIAFYPKIDIGNYIHDLDMTNLTIAGNQSEENLIYYLGTESSVWRNCIIFDNDSPEIDANQQMNVSYCDIEGGFDGENNINADPVFADPENGDYRLTADSPCIDAGDPDSPEDPDGTRADIGAYYFPQEQLAIINVPDDFETIQEAIEAADDGDEIHVAPGVYEENIDYLGKNISVIGSPDDPSQTVIDGGGEGSVVFFEDRVTDAALLSGFTIQNGRGTSFFFDNMFGGGIFIIQSDVVIEHCIIRDNSVEDVFGSPSYGGGIVCYGWIEDTHPTIRDCEIFSNTSEGYGGGISVLAGSNPLIERVNVHDNSAGRGGGVSVIDDCAVTISHSAICDNQSDNSGGGIEISVSSTLDLINATLAGNVADNIGGGLFCASNVQINSLNSIFWDNEPQAVSFFMNEDPCAITLSYSDVENGEDGIENNNNGQVEWLDGNINANPLFVDPENGDYHLTADSPCIDAGDPDGEPDPDGTRADIGAYYFQQEIHRIRLSAGWQMVSTYVMPFEPEMPDVWRDVVERGNLVVVKDNPGHFYSPIWGFNNMEPWDVRFAYMVKMREADELVIVGEPAPEDLPIPLAARWNYVAYFPEADQEAPEAFVNLGDNLIVAKNSNGQFYSPIWGFNNMEPLSRGHGYQICVEEACEFVWNVPDDRMMVAALDQGESQTFTPSLPTWCNMSVLVNATGLPEGAAIGAFDGNGVLVGRGEIQDAICGLAVWGDDPLTPEREGLVEGEGFSLTLLDDESVSLEVLEVLAGDGLKYSTDGFTALSMGERVMPLEFGITNAYPNPFNSTVAISYTVDQQSQVDLKLFDISGRQVATLFSGSQQAGAYRQTLQAENLSSGVYFCRLSTATQSHSQKVVLVR